VRGWPTSRTSSSRPGTEPCTADSRWLTRRCPSPWSATAAAVSTHSQVASSRVSSAVASSGSLPSSSASHSTAYGRRPGSCTTARTEASAGSPTTRSASKARPRSRASSPRAVSSSSATAGATGRAASQARYSARAGPGERRAHARSMVSADSSMCPAGPWAATQICSSLTQTAQLPSAVSSTSSGRCASRGRSAPTRAAASSVQSSSAGSGSCVPSVGGSWRSERSSATRWRSRSSRVSIGTGSLDRCRKDSNCGAASMTSATSEGSGPARAGASAAPPVGRKGWASDQASKSATQPRSTAVSLLSQARSRQPGRVAPPCSSIRPASRARSQAVRIWPGVKPRASAASLRVTSPSMPVGPAVPGPVPAQRASRTASASSTRASRASSGTEGVPSGGRGGLGLRVVAVLRAAVSGRRGTMRSGVSRGLRDVTGAVSPLSARNPKRGRSVLRQALT
jgi:hypothetical protein